MTRNILILSVLCLALGLGGCDQKKDYPRIGVVDAEKVFQGSKLAQNGMAYVEGVSKKFNERLMKMQEAAAADPENQELMQQFQAELMSLQGDFEARQAEAANKMNRLFEAVVAEYRENNNLEVIIPAQMALSSRPGSDVTEAIISLLDSKTLDFGSVDEPVGGTMAAPSPADNEAVPAPAENEAAPAAADEAGTN